MTQPRTLRATGPGDLLALVPVLFGFHPEDSVVLMTVGHAGQPFHARIDLPHDREALADLADYLASVAVHNDADALAVLLYTDRAGPAAAAIALLRDRLAAAGIRLPCAARADGHRWWSLDGPHPQAGPGTPYDVRSHPFTAQAVVDGTVVLGSRRELEESLVGHDHAETEEIGRLADAAADRLLDSADSPLGTAVARHHLVLEGHWVRRRLRTYLADGDRLDVADVARLAVDILASIEVRDVAWSEMDHANAGRHVELWRDLVRRVPEELRAPPAALLAFAAWLSGNGALAWCAVERSQDADPGYGLAGLVAQALSGAVPPAVWTPLDPGELTLFSTGSTSGHAGRSSG